jgi:PAS domain S-box-containing protein
MDLGEALDERRPLAVVMDALAEAVTIRGRDNHVVYANRAALERLGFASVQELRRADPRELLGPYEIADEHGKRVRMEDLPSVRLLRGEQPDPMLLRYVDRSSGEESWVLLKATAVRDPAGAIEAAVTIIEDVTLTRRSQLRLEFLARAGHMLASSLDYQQTLRNVAGLAVPRIADWCALDLFDEDGAREQVAVAHSDPAKVALAERLRALQAPDLDPDRGLGLVRRTGTSALYNEIPDELLVQAAADEDHLALLRELGMRAALIVPMIAGSRTIGALTLVSAESGRKFDRSDVEFAEQIATRAALAVENARLYRERSEVAHTLQRSLLPDALPEIPGWEVAALYRPAGHGNEVGGDFYDFWEVGEGDWLMMIGDVAGKGVAAATVTSLVRHTARAASDFDARPAAILARVDRALKRHPLRSICTALCIRLSGERGTVAAGGHPLPLCLNDRGVREIGRSGTMLGAFAAAAWPESSFSVRPGHTLVAITDGVTDTIGENRERFGHRRLHEVLHSLRSEAPHTIRERLTGALDAFQVGAQTDDTAVVVMRLTAAATKRGAPEVHRESVTNADKPGSDAYDDQAVAIRSGE